MDLDTICLLFMMNCIIDDTKLGFDRMFDQVILNLSHSGLYRKLNDSFVSI